MNRGPVLDTTSDGPLRLTGHDALAAHADAELSIDPAELAVVLGGAAGLALTYSIGRLFGSAVQ